MINLFQNQILFFLAVAFAMFLPGYFLLLAIFRKSAALSALEKFIVSFGLSIVSVDFILFFYSRFNFPINRQSSIFGILLFILICFAIYKYRFFRKSSALFTEKSRSDLFAFSGNQFVLILLLIFLTFFIKTSYLSNTVYPTATDMGHHMYWSKWIKDTGKLPNYEDSVATKEDVGKFIIGEHTIFAEIALLGNLDFFSAFPPLVLYLVNILGILTVFILTLRIFKKKNVAIFSLLFLGVLYAISSPQAKYISGGVIGNIFGNFLMPLAFYFYFRSFESIEDFFQGKILSPERKTESSKFLSLAIFVTFGLLYTHHLTAFILILVFLLLIPLYFLVNYRDLEKVFKKFVEIIWDHRVFGTFILGLVFFFFVFTPSYISLTAVDTAVGAPTKATRVGLSLDNLRQTAGEARIALGALGFLFLVLNYRRKNFGFALLTSWAVMLFIMSVYPKLLFVDIPSSRIGNYIGYPLAILGALGFSSVFEKEDKKMPAMLWKSGFAIIFVFVLVSGMNDSAQAFKKETNSNSANQTFHASWYLAKNSSPEDKVIKDHNYITADAWIKLFFMRGYKYPQSRGYFRRYEEASGNREMCTLNMISNPAGEEAQKCFSESGTNFIMVNPLYDSAQFRKLSNFDQVYISDELAIYYRK